MTIVGDEKEVQGENEACHQRDKGRVTPPTPKGTGVLNSGSTQSVFNEMVTWSQAIAIAMICSGLLLAYVDLRMHEYRDQSERNLIQLRQLGTYCENLSREFHMWISEETERNTNLANLFAHGGVTPLTTVTQPTTASHPTPPTPPTTVGLIIQPGFELLPSHPPIPLGTMPATGAHRTAEFQKDCDFVIYDTFPRDGRKVPVWRSNSSRQRKNWGSCAFRLHDLGISTILVLQNPMRCGFVGNGMKRISQKVCLICLNTLSSKYLQRVHKPHANILSTSISITLQLYYCNRMAFGSKTWRPCWFVSDSDDGGVV